MKKYVIQTNKGYICEKNAKGTYKNKNNDFYRVETGKWFTTLNAGCNDIDCLGFCKGKEEATRYSACIGNRVQEIADRIRYGLEDITWIRIEIEEEA